jgi:predicted RNA binding protein YcfA (HicA-like mRNA interferase family)
MNWYKEALFADLPSLKCKNVVGFLEANGFVFRRQKSSHMIFSHPDGRTAVIACHGKEYQKKQLPKLLRQVNMDIDQFKTYFQ